MILSSYVLDISANSPLSNRSSRKLGKGVVFLTFAILIATIGLFTAIPLVVEGKTITVDQDGEGDTTTIAEGISLAEEGDEILVHSGTYAENLEINKKVILQGAGNESTFIVGNGSGSTILLSAPEVVISGFHVSGGGGALRDGGIEIISDRNTISSVNCSENSYGGIVVSQSEGNRISGVTARSNGKSGIEIFESPRTTVQDSTVLGNPTGVNCAFSSAPSFENILVRQSTEGMRFYRSSGCTIESSIIRGNGFGIYFLESSDQVVEDAHFLGNNFALVIDQGGNSYLKGLMVDHNTNGIIFWKTGENRIEACNISMNSLGIRIDRSSNNTVNNSLLLQNILGIQVEDNSRDNLVSKSHFSNNTEAINATGDEGFPIDAISNYWGNATGPYHYRNNANGTGDPVSDLVNFSPWLKSYPPEPAPAEDEIPLLDILSFLLIVLILLLAITINYGDLNRGDT
jgi:nitrous oxidase accessory protein